jgi:hypothetical protein
MLNRIARIALLGGALSLLSASAFAQELTLPRPSPNAEVEVDIGVTEVEVSYSSPGVKGRKIFGGLVPWGELWRTGANAPTTISFSHDVKVGGAAVPAGTYSLFTIPGDKEWTVILNKNDKAGTRDYDEKLDAARFKAKPSKIPARERMTFVFSDFGDDKGSLDLEWDTTKISIPIEADTHAFAMQNIEKALGGTSRAYANAARYLLDADKDMDQALAWIDKAVALDDNWFNNYIKAQIHAKKGDKAGAVELATKAQAMGLEDEKKGGYFFWKEAIAKSLADWK